MKYSVSHSLNFNTITLFMDLLIYFTNEIVSSCQHHTLVVFNKDLLSNCLMPWYSTCSWIFYIFLHLSWSFTTSWKRTSCCAFTIITTSCPIKKLQMGFLNRLNWRAFIFFYNIESVLLLIPSAIFPAVTIGQVLC